MPPPINPLSPAEIEALKDRIRQNILQIGESCGPPTLLRLAINDALTWDKNSRTGGANGSVSTPGELEHPDNQGLAVAVAKLRELHQEEYKNKITLADLVNLSGVVAVQELGGPKIAFRCGRRDSKISPPPGRLPSFHNCAGNPAKFIRIFERAGMTPRETVALIGCHPFGRWWSKPHYYEQKLYPAMEKFSGTPEGGSPRKHKPEPIPAFDASFYVEIIQGKDPLSKFLLSKEAGDDYQKALKDFADSSEQWFLEYARAYQKLTEAPTDLPKVNSSRGEWDAYTIAATVVGVGALVAIGGWYWLSSRRHKRMLGFS